MERRESALKHLFAAGDLVGRIDGFQAEKSEASAITTKGLHRFNYTLGKQKTEKLSWQKS